MAVKFRELEELGIADKITTFSYRKGKTVYLEEDCDLGLFFETYKAKYGARPSYRDSYKNYSPVRNFERYFYNKMKGEQNEIA